MSRVTVDEQVLTDIADAIREKNGEQTQYRPGDMAAAIEDIETGITPTGSVSITQNGTTDVTNYASAAVNVPNSYSSSDNGKVVSNGALVAQTAKNITTNGTHDTTTNNSVVVAVPNSYESGDEGKVVSNGALVAQTSQTVTENGTYDTTLKNSLVVNVEGGGGSGGIAKLTPVYEGLSYGYIASGNFTGYTTKTNYLLLFEVESPKTYVIRKTDTSGNRCRAGFFSGKTLSDFTNGIENSGSSQIFSGVSIVDVSATTSQTASYTTATSGIIAVMTSSNSVAAKAYCIDIDASGGGTLVQKTITQNGTYDPADDNADGYSQVVVNVESGGDAGWGVGDASFEFTMNFNISASEVVS